MVQANKANSKMLFSSIINSNWKLKWCDHLKQSGHREIRCNKWNNSNEKSIVKAKQGTENICGISRKVGSLIIAISHINALLKLNGNADAAAPHKTHQCNSTKIFYIVFYGEEEKKWRAWTNRDYLTYERRCSFSYSICKRFTQHTAHARSHSSMDFYSFHLFFCFVSSLHSSTIFMHCWCAF